MNLKNIFHIEDFKFSKGLLKKGLSLTLVLALASTQLGGSYAQVVAKTTTSTTTKTSTTSPAGVTTPSKTQVNPLATAIDKLLETYYKTGSFQGSVILSQNGKVLLSKGYGNASEEFGVPNTEKTVFRLASLSKQITAAGVLKLVEQKKLGLNDSISKYIPDFPNGDKITIKMLLNHTSGLQDQTVQTGKTEAELMRLAHTSEELLAMIKAEKLVTEPGKSFYYSNHGYILLGYIMEKVSGVSYGKYLADNILSPLGIKDIYTDENAAIVKNRAEGYKMVSGVKKKADPIDMSNPLAAGSLLGTTEAYLKWQQNYYNTKILTKTSWDALFNMSTKTNRTTLFDERYGLGIMGTTVTLLTGKNVKVSYHTGGINGFRNFEMHIDGLGVDFVLLSNNEGLNLEELLSAILFVFMTQL